ncbi:MAG: tRNA dihydrouridine(20/20a) synthase DusA [Neisseriaceae bacterium]
MPVPCSSFTDHKPATEQCSPWKLSVAPMLDWTDRHYRYLARLLSPHARLYTEMVHAGAILYGERENFLKFHSLEHPLALQLGGNDPKQLAQACRLAQKYQFDEINLNGGCPSPRVTKGSFGATLMLQVKLAIDCLRAMQDSTELEVTFKHRIGVDKECSYSWLRDFVGQIAYESQCQVFIVHARNAWLKGLSPKENRRVPPLNYEYVHRLKQDFPQLTIVLNGGITDLQAVQTQIAHVDGVMVGRQAYRYPLSLLSWEQVLFNESYNLDETTLIQQLYLYAEEELKANPQIKLKNIVKHYLGLFHGWPNARIWRRMLSNTVHLEANNPQIILDAFAAFRQTSPLKIKEL